jgi:hypothetical protein
MTKTMKQFTAISVVIVAMVLYDEHRKRMDSETEAWPQPKPVSYGAPINSVSVHNTSSNVYDGNNTYVYGSW